jgi:hypothetical protein
MDGQNANKKRGRPLEYASAEEKARADVELRRKEAHERLEVTYPNHTNPLEAQVCL